MKIIIKIYLRFMAVILTFLASLPVYADNKPFTIMLDWLINPNHAPLFVAEQQGFFAKQGLAVKFIIPADPNDPAKLVAANQVDIAIDYQPHLLLALAQGLPLKQIGTLIPHPLASLVVLADSSITHIKQLKGKQVGVATSEIDSLMLKTMLAHNNIQFDEVKIINVHYDLIKALLTKKITAAQGLMRNIELPEMQTMQQPGLAFYPEKNGVPDYAELIFITKKGHESDPRIRKFLTALQQGVNYLIKNPESSWQVFVKAHTELNNETNHSAWLATTKYFTPHPEKIDNLQCQIFANYLDKELQRKIPATACTAITK